MGYLWTHLPEPPYNIVCRPNVSGSLEPFSGLAPAQWAATSAAYIRDLDALEAHLTKPRKTPQTKPPKPDGKDGKTRDGKGKGGGAGGDGATGKDGKKI